jgi:hypothetical protein
MPRRTAACVIAIVTTLAACFAAFSLARAANAPPAPARPATDPLARPFRWKVSPPLLAPAQREGETCYSVKDPSVVRDGGRWHLFCTIRGKVRSHQIEYIRFADWPDAAAGKAERHVLRLSDGYFCAPQVFYFEPHRKWYMVLQVNDKSRKPELQPAFSTTEDLSKPDSWSKPTLLFEGQPGNVNAWIDFWVICDEQKAHLFFTSNNGRRWRSETKLADFPRGWSRPQVVLEGDIFEASHTYRLKGQDKYLTVIEAVAPGGRRYYKAYVADRLDGKWTGIADTLDKPFAGLANTHPAGGDKWTDSFSHGELLREGIDQRLEVDPAHLRFLFQGVSDADRQGKPYGLIPWRLGLLEPE